MDMWCDFCEDRPISAEVKVQGKIYGVCNSCKSMTTQDAE